MRYEYIKIILFWSLVSTLPGMIFLIQVIMLMPANMMFAYVVRGLSEAPGEWGLVLFFMVCFLITVGVWAVITIPLAKLICLVKNKNVRNVLLLLILIALFSLTCLPIYGSGGHGPMRWVTAAGLDDAGLNYWMYVFPSTLVVALWHLWFRRRRIHEAKEEVVDS